MNIIEKYDNYFAFSGVLFNLALVVQTYLLWINAVVSDVDKIYTIAVLVSFEFFMIHSGVFMAVFSKKVSLFLFFPLYGLFALVINKMSDDNFVIYTYLFIMFQRTRFAFSNVATPIKNKAVLFSVYAALIWMLVMFIIAINSDTIPMKSLTNDFLNLSGYNKKHSIGMFTEKPHLALLFAIIYYSLLALTEFNLTRSYINNPARFKDSVLKK